MPVKGFRVRAGGWLWFVSVCSCAGRKHRVRVVVLRDGEAVRVWMGVTGLLFENYIVDASILKIIKCNFR